MLIPVLKTALLGTLIGLLLGVLAGGLSMVVLGPGFVEEQGVDLFQLGMYFPGLVFFAPVTAVIGAVVGASRVSLRGMKSRQEIRKPDPTE